MVNGSETEFLRMNPTGFIFNEGSVDLDFRVESNGNTHQLFVDGGNDRVYVGAGSGSSIGSNKFQVQNGGATISSFANDSGSNQLHFIKSRNTSPGSQTIVNDGDSVGGIFFKADDGDATDYNNNAAGIEAIIDGTPGTNDTPGRLVFYTTADGARTNTERMRIDKSGKVGIGETAPLCAANGLHIKSGDSGQGTANPHADELVVEGSANSGINILSGASGYGSVFFGDSGDSNAGEVTYNHSSNYMAFATSGTERFRISSDGLAIGGTGAANSLDDYEEGTFTPTLVSSGATFGYTHQKGFYTKIGNAVTFNIHFQLDGGSNSFSANAVTITGLPFTSANVSGQLYRFYTFGRLVDVQGTGATGIVSSLNQNATTISILESGDNVAGNALNSNQLSSSSGQVFVQGTYYV